MNIFQTHISVYNGVTDNTGTRMPLGTFLFCKEYKDDILRLRAVFDKEKRNALKRSLPQATISGVFSPTRAKNNLSQHSGLICVDIDAKDNPDILDWETLKQDLSVLPQIAYCALSVSGKGLFLVIPLRYPEKHLQQFRQLQIDFRKMGIMIDSACSDITRLRCLSYDEHPIINENATLYEGVYVEKPKHKSFPTCFIYEGENTSAEVAVCCRKIHQCGIDITASYDDWLKVGCALATLGENGRSLFHICSQQNAKYNATKTDKMFTDLLRRNYQQVNIGTFFWMCKQYGITTKE
jgi:virE protein